MANPRNLANIAPSVNASGGNVSIGNTVASTIDAVNTSGNLVVGSGSGSEGISVYSGTTGLGSLCFADGTTTTSTYSGYITYNHSTNHMEFGTNSGVERMRLNSSGALVLQGGTTTADGVGITFPSSQSASTNANTLDDYEEGDFTPTVTFASGSGATFTNRSGKYTKIGRIVFIQVNIFFSSLGTSSGAFTFGGLPFTIINDGYLGRITGSAFLDRMTNGYPFSYGNSTAFTITSIPNGSGSSADLTAANLVSNTYINVNFSYIIS